MTVRTYLGDRRTAIRFQVKGQLWASVETRHDAVLRNITTNGALIEARLSDDMKSIRSASIHLPVEGLEVMVLVRHVTPMTVPVDDRHLLGLEFMKITTDQRRAIELFIREWKQRATRSS